MLTSTLVIALCSALALAAPAPGLGLQRKSRTYPFNRVVAFGDNLSDNGNGSYAWCIQAGPGKCNNSIYGHRTWTNGPVAVSYLVDMLKMPLAYDFAIGHANGGSKFGSTIDNNYTNSPANVSSAYQQIWNYTSHKTWSTGIDKTLHFLWTGNNDINWQHTSPGTDNHTAFANQFSALMAGAVQTLLNAGAEYVFVPGIYARNISPNMIFWTNSQTQRDNVGLGIQQANAATKKALAPFGKKVLYYDVYSFMMEIWNNHDQWNITHVGGEFCDGYSQADWDLCIIDGKGYEFFWTQYLDPTTIVHKYIAQNMYKAIYSHSWS